MTTGTIKDCKFGFTISKWNSQLQFTVHFLFKFISRAYLTSSMNPSDFHNKLAYLTRRSAQKFEYVVSSSVDFSLGCI